MKHKLSIIVVIVLLFINDNCLFSQVLTPSKGLTTNVQSINGIWKFKYVAGDVVNADSIFFTRDFNVSNWSNIKVPGNWELQGFAEPTYGKILKKGIGLYATSFKTPKNWNGKPIYITFDGVQSGYTFWVNGTYAGEFASSFNRQTFDISAFVLPGKMNKLAVKVITQPKGWEFDTNDDWSVSGIFRDVTVFCLPHNHIKDVEFKTFVNKENASLDINTWIEKTTLSKNLKLSARLLDASGKLVKEFAISENQKQTESGVINFSERVTIDQPKLWSAETPYLYTLQLSLKNKNKVIQEYSDHIGIREVSWNDGILKLNGLPIKLKGVNHHDFSPVYGRSITEPEMIQDLKLMRQANVNFIRLCHYPPHARFLELCDSLGFYVMDEVPYGFGDERLKDTSYLPILKLRAKATIDRDKNRPCVIAWSVGNEHQVTDIGLKTGRYVKSLDNTRPYCFPQYPSEFEKMTQAMPDSLDMLDDHYPKLSELKGYATKFDKPMIVSEYAHALGLDFGSMEDLYEVMYANPKLAGGAVWGFFDQGILRKASKPIKKGESTLYAWVSTDSLYDTSGNQGADGILYANRVPQTDYFQVRKVYTPVKALDDTLLYSPGKQTFQIKVNNRYDFTNLSAIGCKWQLMADTIILDSGNMSLSGAPHETVAAVINTILPEKPLANFYYLKIAFEDKDHCQFYEKSYPIVVKRNLLLLNRLAIQNSKKPVKINNTIETGNYRLELTKDSTGILLKNITGELIFSEGPFARVGRKPTISQDAAIGKKRDQPLHTLWSPYLLSNPIAKVKTFNAQQLIVNATYRPQKPENKSLSGNIAYNFSDSGLVKISYRFVANGNEEALETGLSFLIPSSYNEFRWVGKGPYAACPGKDRLSEFGIYHLNSNDLYFAGNRQEVECAVFTNDNGDGFALIADKANISVERTEAGIVISHDATVSGRFNKYEWPNDLCTLNNKEIKGSFSIVPFSVATWPIVLKDIFGNAKKTTNAFQPFYHSYDQ